MTVLRRLVQLALAALLASAGGGLVLALLALAVAITATVAGGAAVEPGDLPLALAMALVLGGLMAAPAVGAAWLPAFAAGAALWAAGRTRAWARRPLAWAAAGAAVALIVFLNLTPEAARGNAAFGPLAPWIAFLLAGALAGEAFRSAMAATAPFLGLDEDEEEPVPARRSL